MNGKMKLLFVIGSANMGGAVSSLINMLVLLKENGIDADVFMMAHTGEFYEEIENSGSILPENQYLAATVCKREYLKKKYGLKGVFFRCLIAIGNRLGTKVIKESTYKIVAAKIPKYDVVIAYQEGYATDFVKYIHARKKIAWVHTIYQKFKGAYKKESQLYDTYNTYNKIVCVAAGAVDAMCKGMPALKNKVCLIPNPIITSRIRQCAEENIDNKLLKYLDNRCTFIVSVGRLSTEKQYDVAVRVANKLNKENKHFIWFIVGDGPEKNNLQRLINEYQLKEQVILTGLLLNPYPLIKYADILVISSVYEAQPMVANEALILGTPVITTNYPTAYTLIRDNINGMICENSCYSITNAILKYIEDDIFANNLKRGAEAFEYDNNSIIKSLEELLEK